MNYNLFTANDFQMCANSIEAAAMANSILRKTVDKWPSISSKGNGTWFEANRADEDKFIGKLCFVEVIPCKHQPVIQHLSLMDTVCLRCGVKLEATWSEKK